MFVSNFFHIFPNHFQNLKNQKANRVQVHPDAKVNFRKTITNLSKKNDDLVLQVSHLEHVVKENQVEFNTLLESMEEKKT